jgi:serine/threonine protein kinase
MTDVSSANQGQSSGRDFMALRPGQKIGRYEIVSLLGRGGFGITYRARDTQLDREVAIKEYLPSALAVRQDGLSVLPQSTRMADDFTWGRERFAEEGRTLATLQHAPAIVEVFDFLEANGTAYIVMKLMPGETLKNRLKRGTLDQPALERILWPLLEGLEQVHATGFLHRDIKPANILLDAQGNPTLIDFGASRAAMAGRTAALTAIFTPGYAAPEQFSSAKQGPWTDIYGLAATLHHAITGAAPPSAFDRLIEDTYRPLGEVKPAGFAPGLLAGLDAGLVLRASDRPQSIAAWRMVLGQGTTAGGQPTVMLETSGAAPTRVLRPRESRQPEAPPPSRAQPSPMQPSPAQPAPSLLGLLRSRRRRRRIVLAIIVVIVASGGIQRFAQRHGWFEPAAPTISPDGQWRGSYHCGANDIAGEFTLALDLAIANGSGKWVRPPTEKSRTLSLTLTVQGANVIDVREFERRGVAGALFATSTARYSGSRIKGSGAEDNSRGRVCELELTRVP